MSNATAAVKQGAVRRTDEFMHRSTETLASATTYYQQAFIGIDETGYYCKGDDTQAWIFGGIVAGDTANQDLAAGTAGAAALELRIQRPLQIEVTLASVAVTDIGKTVYALYDNEVSLTFSATTYANVVGHVIDKVATNVALVELAYDGTAANTRLQAAKRMAATGTETLSCYDVGKTIFIANTAAKTVNLPPIAVCQAGKTLRFVKDHASDTNAITLDPDGSEVIDASSTVATMDAPYDNILVVSNGVKWINQDGVA